MGEFNADGSITVDDMRYYAEAYRVSFYTLKLDAMEYPSAYFDAEGYLTIDPSPGVAYIWRSDEKDYRYQLLLNWANAPMDFQSIEGDLDENET